MKLPTKIPTILGLILVIIVAIVAIVIFENLSRIPAAATGSIIPKNIEFSNQTDTALTLTWETDNPTTGAISLKNAKGQQVFYDERDLTGSLNKYETHSVTARNLTPETIYTYEILSNGKKFKDATGKISTTQTVLDEESVNREPAYGNLLLETQDGNTIPATGAIIYLNLDGSQLLSTLVKPSGSWIIPLNLIRNLGNQGYLQNTDEKIPITIRARFKGLESRAETDTLNDSPVPAMSIGKNYDFRNLQGKAQSSFLAQNTNETVLGEQITNIETKNNYSVTLSTPVQDATITHTLPYIQGSGIPNKLVTITLGINKPVSATTTVKNDGTWEYTPNKPLSPGKQMVTITSLDQNNEPIAITHLFTVFKSGTQVLGDATPSATLTPTMYIVNSTPTPTSTIAGEPIPTSGSTLPTIILITISFMLFFSGISFAYIK